MSRRFFPSVISILLAPTLLAQQTTEAVPAATQEPSAAVAPQTSQLPPPHTILDGTPVKLRLSQTISSADAKVGQEVPFEVVEDLKIDDLVVLPKGAVAIANVTEAEHKKSMGRAGKLNVSISYARLADQEKLALRAVKESKGGGHVGAMTGAIVATSIVFFPAAPLFLFIHGKDISIPQGTEITAFVEGDMRLDMARFGASPASSVQVAGSVASSQVTLAIDSTPPGADIEVDGGFAGNTPSTITVTSGSHDIAVKKKGFVDWTKTLKVSGGSIHLNAELEAAKTQRPAATTWPPPSQPAQQQ
jgi:hypothetical protein